MPIQFHCSQCQSMLQTPEEMAGKQCKCPTCGNVMPIPSPESLHDSPSPVEMPFSDPLPDYSPNPFTETLASQPTDDAYQGLQPHRGEMILTFGILSLIASVFSCGCCPFMIPIGIGFGVPAVVMGRTDLRAMDENLMNPAGRGTTNAGMICGMIGAIIGGLAVALFFIQIIFGLVGAVAG